VRLVQAGVEHVEEHPVPTVFGVTNPYFVRACSQCPNMLTIPYELESPIIATSDAQAGSAGQPKGSSMLTTLFTASGSFHSDILSGKLDGVWLKRGTCCAGPDKNVLSKVRVVSESTAASGGGAANNILRSHFMHLTTSFLTPICDYLCVDTPWSAHLRPVC
jgi:hypothetical protein